MLTRFATALTYALTYALFCALTALPVWAQSTVVEWANHALDQERNGDLDGAISSLSRAIALYDSDGFEDPFLLSDLYFYKALYQYRDRDRTAALTTLDAAGQRTPMLTKRLPEYSFLRGQISFDLGLFLSAGTSFETAARWMETDGWRERFANATIAQLRVRALFASSRASFYPTEDNLLRPLESELETIETLTGRPYAAGLLMRLRVLEDLGRVLEAREGYLELAQTLVGLSQPDLRAASLASAAMIDWRLGDETSARALARDALDIVGLPPEQVALMAFLLELPETHADVTAVMRAFESRVSGLQSIREPSGFMPYGVLVATLEMMQIAFGYLEDLPATAGTLAPDQVDLSLLSADSFPQDAYVQRMIYDIRLRLAEHFERGGYIEAARVEYEAVRLWINVQTDAQVRALSGLARVGPVNSGVFSETDMRAILSGQAFDVTEAFLSSIPARQTETLKRQIARYAAIMEQAVETGYRTLQADPPLGPCEPVMCRQTGPFVFPWVNTPGDGYVGLDQGGTYPGLLEDVFRQIQTMRNSEAGRAIAAMTERLATGDGDLAARLRDRDRMIAARAAARAQGLAGQSEVLRLDQELDRIEADLADRFPSFATQAALEPLTLAQARDLLHPDESLVLYLATETGLHVFAVTPEKVIWYRAAAERQWLRRSVDRLRQALDPTRAVRGAFRLDEDEPEDPFDLDLAHALYMAALGPVTPHLPAGGTLLIAPDDALQSLPFGVLVSAPKSDLPDGLNGSVPWAIRDFAFATLPTASSLKSLRAGAGASTGDLAFLGVGNPVFNEAAQGVRLAPLPETATELSRLSASIAGDAGRMLLGTDASEDGLKASHPGAARVIAFATHGLLGGEARGLGEPALALTPEPGRADGLLRASEIATLDLDADWIILSACNTAAGPTADSTEGLSGLARAFFYAGARRLLVSHWPVQSDATVELTTSMFAALADQPAGMAPGTASARALRAAMLGMIDSPARDRWRHPSAWAPFVVAGG